MPMRLFIGIPLAEETADELAAIVARLRAHLPDQLRWSAREGWHITLQFLGSTTPAQYDCVVASLRTLRHAPVRIHLGPLGSFDRAGVLYVDVRVTPQLSLLQQSVVAATAPCGFQMEDRPYHPHITLVRRRSGSAGRKLGTLPLPQRQFATLPAFTAMSILLYESISTPAGSRYHVRDRFPLD